MTMQRAHMHTEAAIYSEACTLTANELLMEFDAELRRDPDANYSHWLERFVRRDAAKHLTRFARAIGVPGHEIEVLVADAVSVAMDSTLLAAEAYIATMKADLRNLVTAQEAYFADHSQYPGTLTTTQYQASTGVTISNITPGTGTFSANAAFVGGTTRTCTIQVGTGQFDGEPRCN